MSFIREPSQELITQASYLYPRFIGGVKSPDANLLLTILKNDQTAEQLLELDILGDEGARNGFGKPITEKLTHLTKDFYSELIKLGRSQARLALFWLSTLQLIKPQESFDEFVKKVLSTDGVAIGYIPKDLLTPELCHIAVKNNPEAILYVPTTLVTSDLIDANKESIEKFLGE